MDLLPLDGFVVGVTSDRRQHAQVALLEGRGAQVLVGPSVDPVAAWRLIEAACDTRIDAVTFTASSAVHDLFRIAIERGADGLLRQALNGAVVTVCQDAACAQAATVVGINGPLVPARARLGAVVQSLVVRLGATRRALVVEGMPVVTQGRTLLIGDKRVTLSDREHAVLRALVQKSGAVVPRALLLRIWGTGESDGRVVDATVARLRQRLGPAASAVVSVPRRGYRLDAQECEAS